MIRAARRELHRLGISRATSIDEAVALVAAAARAKVSVFERDFGPGLSGLLARVDDAYHVYWSPREAPTNSIRDHVIAHELGHILNATVCRGFEFPRAVLHPYTPGLRQVRLSAQRSAEERAEAIAYALCAAIATHRPVVDRILDPYL